jgi:uncharacterized membrane protein YjdF
MPTAQKTDSTRSADRSGWLVWLLIAALIVVVTVAVLYAMGRAPFPKGGTQFWYGVRSGPGQSLHFTDVYSFTHVVHGPVYFLLLWLIFKKGLKWTLPAGLLFVLAVGIEAVWEIFENSSFVINRYRQNRAYTGYTGDTIVNSVGDILAMMLGYLFTMRFRGFLPAFGLVVALEVGLYALAGDNFTISLIRLIAPGIVP